MQTSFRKCVFVVVLVGVAVVAVTACGKQNPDVDSRSATQGLPNMKTELIAKLWTLDPAASSPALGYDGDVTLEFSADGRISGRGPCNNYTGSVDYGTSSVTVADVAMTMMACEPDAMEAETAFHDALESVDAVKLTPDHSKLTLKGSGDIELVFHGSKLPADAVD